MSFLRIDFGKLLSNEADVPNADYPVPSTCNFATRGCLPNLFRLLQRKEALPCFKMEFTTPHAKKAFAFQFQAIWGMLEDHGKMRE